ncbi:MAG: twin-arginine translocase subunit TatC [Flavobacteriales bacterium]|nr:twin-arginine translocase subunit TatC [Flavobacteriales bacterium]
MDLGQLCWNTEQFLLWTGVAFELPIVMLLLARIGIVGPAFLRKYRKHAFVVILIVAAIITPPDVVSQMPVSLPLLLLYEISILLAARAERLRLDTVRPTTGASR